MRSVIPHPCMGPSWRALSTSMSSVPCSRSPFSLSPTGRTPLDRRKEGGWAPLDCQEEGGMLRVARTTLHCHFPLAHQHAPAADADGGDRARSLVHLDVDRARPAHLHALLHDPSERRVV